MTAFRGVAVAALLSLTRAGCSGGVVQRKRTAGWSSRDTQVGRVL